MSWANFGYVVSHSNLHVLCGKQTVKQFDEAVATLSVTLDDVARASEFLRDDRTPDVWLDQLHLERSDSNLQLVSNLLEKLEVLELAALSNTMTNTPDDLVSLSVYLRHHDSAHRDDSVCGAYWRVEGVTEMTAAGTRFEHVLELARWIEVD